MLHGVHIDPSICPSFAFLKVSFLRLWRKMNIKGSLSYQLHFVDEQSTDGKPTDQNEMHFVLILTLLLGKLLYLLLVCFILFCF